MSYNLSHIESRQQYMLLFTGHLTRLKVIIYITGPQPSLRTPSFPILWPPSRESSWLYFYLSMVYNSRKSSFSSFHWAYAVRAGSSYAFLLWRHTGVTVKSGETTKYNKQWRIKVKSSEAGMAVVLWRTHLSPHSAASTRELHLCRYAVPYWL